MNWEKIRQWIYRKYDEENQPEINELVWVRKKVKAGEKIDWTFVDTVDYDLDSIPRKRELIVEFRAKPKEVAKKCQSLLNWKKEPL